MKEKFKRLLIMAMLPLLTITLSSCGKEDEQVVPTPPQNETGQGMTNDYVSVIQHGIKNDGSVIGKELNELVKKSYGKTLYFPAGTYNLSEPIVTPYDYTKNVNIVFDHNAIIKSDTKLEALLKVGYSEMSTPDRLLRVFSYIEGGIFDCENADNGIIVNGLKQLVTLKYITLYKGRKAHIRVQVSDDFAGTGSSDTKIENVFIRGMSSNEEIYGIYIDRLCHDIKISNTFIYCTKYAIYTKSAGHIINNVHILSGYTTGGVELGNDKNYRDTQGIRIEADGFYMFNEIYFDTVDKCIFVADVVNPSIIMDKGILFSYIPNFGTSFIYKNPSAQTPFQVKISNSIIEVAKQGYKIFDISPTLIGNDFKQNFSFVNPVLRKPHLISPYDPSLTQRIRGVSSDALFDVNLSLPPSSQQWYALGAALSSKVGSALKISLTDNCAIELNLSFEKGTTPNISSKILGDSSGISFQLGYIVKDDYCVLLIKPSAGTLYPIIQDLSGSSAFMSTPSKDKTYTLQDYGLTGSPEIIIEK